MHILHLIKTSEGAAWALNLIKELRKSFPILSFSVAIPLGGKYTPEYKLICRNVYEFDYQVNSSIVVRGIKLQRIVENDNPNIIHSWFAQTTLYTRLFLRNYDIPKIFQVVGPLHLENNIFKWGDIKSASKYDYWIATSKYIYEKYKLQNVDEKKLFLNYAYIDAIKLLEDKKQIEPLDLKQKLKIPIHYKIIGTASYIYPPKFYKKTGVKGHEHLLFSFKEVLKKRKDVALIIAGGVFGKDNGYLKRLKKLANQIDPERIFFTGAYKHIYEVISNFDIFVYLSESENLGGVFESLLFEIPTISSNRGALPELVIHNKTGFLASPENYVQISMLINDILEKDNNKLLINGRDKVLEIFDKSAIIKKTFEIYHTVSN